jgi:transposase
MTKSQFQSKIKALKQKGITIKEIAKRIGYSTSTIRRAKNNNWKGNCSRVYGAFKRIYK